MLAESPKSIRTYSAYKKAKSLVRDTENYPVRFDFDSTSFSLSSLFHSSKCKDASVDDNAGRSLYIFGMLRRN